MTVHRLAALHDLESALGGGAPDLAEVLFERRALGTVDVHQQLARLDGDGEAMAIRGGRAHAAMVVNAVREPIANRYAFRCPRLRGKMVS